jgi:hypothetical protein
LIFKRRGSKVWSDALTPIGFYDDAPNGDFSATFHLAWRRVKGYFFMQLVSVILGFAVKKGETILYLQADGEMAEWLKAMVC